jgi:hypothetical protein
MKTMLFTLFVVGILVPHWIFAQKVDIPVSFFRLLNQAGIEFFEPLDAGYKEIELPENEYQNCQFAIRSGKENMQIRFFILPWNDQDPLATQPNIVTFRTITSVASNADDAVISAIQPDRETLHKDFNADWGMIYFFQPKPGFSLYPNCRMIAICKEGKGTAFIFYLFDDPANEALDTRYLTLRFL